MRNHILAALLICSGIFGMNTVRSQASARGANEREYQQMLSESFMEEIEKEGSDGLIDSRVRKGAVMSNVQEWVSDIPVNQYREVAGRGEDVVREIIWVDFPGFPRYTDTGNPEMDLAAWNLAVEHWAQIHPAEYVKLLPGIEAAREKGNAETRTEAAPVFGK